MKYLISSLLLVLAAHMMSAQDLTPEIVATAGETFSTSNLTLEWTLGEIMAETFTGTVVLTQGFHQPVNNTTSIEDLASAFGTITVYPNPTNSTISIETDRNGSLEIELWDMSGRTVLRQTASAVISRLDLSDLPHGMYMLRLSDGEQAARSIRIKKL